MARIILFTTDWYDTDRDQRLAEGHSPAIGGGAFYRLVLPSVALHAAGHEVFLCPEARMARDGSIVGKAWLPSDEGGDIVPDADIIITQRWMHRDCTAAYKQARAAGQVVIVDMDDDYWSLPPDNAAFVGTHPKYSPEINRNWYWQSLGAADAVICSTPALVKRIERIDVRTQLLRNMIDLDLWKQRNTTLADDKPCVGWTGGTSWRRKDLTQVAAAVGGFVNRHDLRFAHVGNLPTAPAAAKLLGISDGSEQTILEQCPFDEFADEVAKAEIDIGLVPLVNNSFNSAKSCLKGMEWAASGIPFIADALPEYEWFGVGILARKYKHWVQGLERLLDPEERRILATTARARVEKEDYRVRGAQWADLIAEYV